MISKLIPKLKDPVSVLLDLQREVEDINKTIRTVDRVLKNIDAKLRFGFTESESAESKSKSKSMAESMTESKSLSTSITITNREKLVEELERFIDGKAGVETIKACFDYIMNNINCQFCRTMIASALAEAEYGSIEKSRFIALEVYKYLKQELENEHGQAR
ncbi:MAG: hypothetical protein DRO09_02870 [Thermoprotei archaeon]|nr:MAG: hypothetical protein DRO09_02870 [Thermoprotei archaeon]